MFLVGKFLAHAFAWAFFFVNLKSCPIGITGKIIYERSNGKVFQLGLNFR